MRVRWPWVSRRKHDAAETYAAAITQQLLYLGGVVNDTPPLCWSARAGTFYSVVSGPDGWRQLVTSPDGNTWTAFPAHAGLAPALTFKRETDFVSAPSSAEKLSFEPIVPAPRGIVGDQVAECPDCWATLQGVVDTAQAALREQIPGGLRWTGIPCCKCGKTYTIEATERPGGFCPLERGMR